MALASPAWAASSDQTLPHDRKELLRMLEELDLPATASYDQAPRPVRPVLSMRQHDVEEAPRES